jgi:hypothetical protein
VVIAVRGRVPLALGIVGGAAAGVALAAWMSGSHGVALFGRTLPVRALWRPLAVAACLVAGGVSVAVRRRRAVPAGSRAAWDAASGIVLAAVLTAGTVSGVLTWSEYHVTSCGGVDSSGYVSTAVAIVSGTLIQPQPIVHWLPFPDGIMAVMPLGWVPSVTRDAIVPAYPLGFPMAMAAAIVAGGREAAFYVPLLAGLGILALTWRLARHASDAVTAAAAVLVVAFNPVLTNMAIQPMSDAPAAFWFLLAFTSLAVAPARPVLAGLAFGMAVWTRPLVGAAIPALLIVMSWNRRTLLRFVAGGVPVAAAMAAGQWWLYGGPLRTGYGATAGLFTTANVGRHLAAFGGRTIEAHTWLLPATLALASWRGPRRLALAALAGVGVGIVPYLFNLQVFDDFDVVRYLLPPLVPCLIAATVGVAALVKRAVPQRWAAVAIVVLAAVTAAASHAFVASRSPAMLRFQESRYPAVGEWVRQHTPQKAVWLADLQSGALRVYADRQTLRWGMVPPGGLGATVDALASHGADCYAAVDGGDEERAFGEVLAASPTIAAEPLARVRTVTIYRVARKS